MIILTAVVSAGGQTAQLFGVVRQQGLEVDESKRAEGGPHEGVLRLHAESVSEYVSEVRPLLSCFA